MVDMAAAQETDFLSRGVRQMKLKELIFGSSTNTGNSVFYRDSSQAWLPIKNIVGGMVITKDNRFIKICEVLPVNFYLKSPSDQENIISSFASFLQIAPDNVQIIVQTQKADMAEYISRMQAYVEAEENEKCREMIEDNISEVSWVGSNTAIARRFFLVFQYEPQMKPKRNTVRSIAERLREEADTAQRYLEVCGLEVLEPRFADNALLELLYEIINKNLSRRVKLPVGVFDMTTTVHGVYHE